MEKIKFYTLKQVAEMLGVSERSMYRYIKEKRINAIKVGYWKISEKDLGEFMQRYSNIKK